MTINVLLLILIIIMTLLGSVASFFLKKSSANQSMKDLLQCANLYIGASLYLVSAIFNIIILKYLDFSIVLPLTSITYVWTMILSYWKLKEKITTKKIIGIFCIILGAMLVAIKS